MLGLRWRAGSAVNRGGSASTGKQAGQSPPCPRVRTRRGGWCHPLPVRRGFVSALLRRQWGLLPARRRALEVFEPAGQAHLPMAARRSQLGGRRIREDLGFNPTFPAYRARWPRGGATSRGVRRLLRSAPVRWIGGGGTNAASRRVRVRERLGRVECGAVGCWPFHPVRQAAVVPARGGERA